MNRFACTGKVLTTIAAILLLVSIAIFLCDHFHINPLLLLWKMMTEVYATIKTASWPFSAIFLLCGLFAFKEHAFPYRLIDQLKVTILPFSIVAVAGIIFPEDMSRGELIVLTIVLLACFTKIFRSTHKMLLMYLTREKITITLATIFCWSSMSIFFSIFTSLSTGAFMFMAGTVLISLMDSLYEKTISDFFKKLKK